MKDFFSRCICLSSLGSPCWGSDPKRLPELGKGIGEGIRGFQAAMHPQQEENPTGRTDMVSGKQS